MEARFPKRRRRGGQNRWAAEERAAQRRGPRGEQESVLALHAEDARMDLTTLRHFPGRTYYLTYQVGDISLEEGEKSLPPLGQRFRATSIIRAFLAFEQAQWSSYGPTGVPWHEFRLEYVNPTYASSVKDLLRAKLASLPADHLARWRKSYPYSWEVLHSIYPAEAIRPVEQLEITGTG